MEHPATLPLRQIDLPPLPDATISQYNQLPNIPAATAAYLNKAMHAELAAVPDSLYHVTRANRVIAVVELNRFVVCESKS